MVDIAMINWMRSIQPGRRGRHSLALLRGAAALLCTPATSAALALGSTRSPAPACRRGSADEAIALGLAGIAAALARETAKAAAPGAARLALTPGRALARLALAPGRAPRRALPAGLSNRRTYGREERGLRQYPAGEINFGRVSFVGYGPRRSLFP